MLKDPEFATEMSSVMDKICACQTPLSASFFNSIVPQQDLVNMVDRSRKRADYVGTVDMYKPLGQIEIMQ